MLTHQAEELRRGWRGGACPHPDTEREHHEGAPTGNTICCHCGEALWDGHLPTR